MRIFKKFGKKPLLILLGIVILLFALHLVKAGTQVKTSNVKSVKSAGPVELFEAVNEKCKEGGRDGLMLPDLKNTAKYKFDSGAVRMEAYCIELDEKNNSLPPITVIATSKDGLWKVLWSSNLQPTCEAVDGQGINTQVLEFCTEPNGLARPPAEIKSN